MMTKRNVLDCLNEIGHRFVRVASEDDDQQHYKELGIAFGVAWCCVDRGPTIEIELLAQVIEKLALEQGSVQ